MVQLIKTATKHSVQTGQGEHGACKEAEEADMRNDDFRSRQAGIV